MYKRALIVAVVAAASLLIPSQGQAQAEFCVDIDCDCPFLCKCELSFDAFEFGSGSSGCNWAWLYPCILQGDFCEITVDAQPALRERAERAWQGAHIEEVVIGGVTWITAAEVPSSLPPIDVLDGWVASVGEECAERRRSAGNVTDLEPTGSQVPDRR